MTKIERVKKLCKWLIYSDYAENDKELSQLLGYTKSSFSQILNEKVPLSDKFIDKICDLDQNINKVWINTGEGQMLLENSKESLNLNEPSEEYSIINEIEVIKHEEDQEPETFYNEKTGNKYLLYPDGTIRIEVLKIPFSAYASYVECFDDEIKMQQEFSVINFKVDHIGRGRYLGFVSKGDSMWNNGGFDTPSGSEILAREIGRHLWNYGFKKTKYGFILITKAAIYHKDIEGIDELGNLILTSRNPLEPSFKYPINDVLEIFHVIRRSF